jgi:CDP-diacylglycerol--glycerol-3-phosphate 3-phosphatidyltransferase
MPKLNDSAEFLKSLPNKLTLARIAAIPILLLLFPLKISKLNVFCAVIFALAAMTDYFDGYLARKYQSVTPLGALLDPIADKMLIAASLLLLAANGVIPAFVAALMICRDIGINGIRLMAMEQGRTIKVSEFGKWKTFIQSIAIFCLMVDQPLFGLPFRLVGMLTLWIALGLSLYSGWQYATGYLEIVQGTAHDPS